MQGRACAAAEKWIRSNAHSTNISVEALKRGLNHHKPDGNQTVLHRGQHMWLKTLPSVKIVENNSKWDYEENASDKRVL